MPNRSKRASREKDEAEYKRRQFEQLRAFLFDLNFQLPLSVGLFHHREHAFGRDRDCVLRDRRYERTDQSRQQQQQQRHLRQDPNDEREERAFHRTVGGDADTEHSSGAGRTGYDARQQLQHRQSVTLGMTYPSHPSLSFSSSSCSSSSLFGFCRTVKHHEDRSTQLADSHVSNNGNASGTIGSTSTSSNIGNVDSCAINTSDTATPAVRETVRHGQQHSTLERDHEPPEQRRAEHCPSQRPQQPQQQHPYQFQNGQVASHQYMAYNQLQYQQQHRQQYQQQYQHLQNQQYYPYAPHGPMMPPHHHAYNSVQHDLSNPCHDYYKNAYYKLAINKPPEAPPPIPPQHMLYVWKTALDPNTNRYYYYNTHTQISQWIKPNELVAMDHYRFWEKRQRDRHFFQQMEYRLLTHIAHTGTLVPTVTTTAAATTTTAEQAATSAPTLNRSTAKSSSTSNAYNTNDYQEMRTVNTAIDQDIFSSAETITSSNRQVQAQRVEVKDALKDTIATNYTGEGAAEDTHQSDRPKSTSRVRTISGMDPTVLADLQPDQHQLDMYRTREVAPQSSHVGSSYHTTHMMHLYGLQPTYADSQEQLSFAGGVPRQYDTLPSTSLRNNTSDGKTVIEERSEDSSISKVENLNDNAAQKSNTQSRAFHVSTDSDPGTTVSHDGRPPLPSRLQSKSHSHALSSAMASDTLSAGFRLRGRQDVPSSVSEQEVSAVASENAASQFGNPTTHGASKNSTLQAMQLNDKQVTNVRNLPVPTPHQTHCERHLHMKHIRRNTDDGNIQSHTGTSMTNPDIEATIKCICGVYRAHIVQTVDFAESQGMTRPEQMEGGRPLSSRTSSQSSAEPLKYETQYASSFAAMTSYFSPNSVVADPYHAASLSMSFAPFLDIFLDYDYRQQKNRQQRQQQEGRYHSQGNRSHQRRYQQQEHSRSKTDEIPTLTHIIEFFTHLFQRTQMEQDTIIMTLIYVERLIKRTSGTIRPGPSNWKSILVTCMVLASKMWDDLSMWNVEFSNIFVSSGIDGGASNTLTLGDGRGDPRNVSESGSQRANVNGQPSSHTGIANTSGNREKTWNARDSVFLQSMTLPRVNQLELALLQSLQFEVRVAASEYAKYYFLIRNMLLQSGLLSVPATSKFMPSAFGTSQQQPSSSPTGWHRQYQSSDSSTHRKNQDQAPSVHSSTVHDSTAGETDHSSRTDQQQQQEHSQFLQIEAKTSDYQQSIISSMTSTTTQTVPSAAVSSSSTKARQLRPWSSSIEDSNTASLDASGEVSGSAHHQIANLTVVDAAMHSSATRLPEQIAAVDTRLEPSAPYLSSSDGGNNRILKARHGHSKSMDDSYWRWLSLSSSLSNR